MSEKDTSHLFIVHRDETPGNRSQPRTTSLDSYLEHWKMAKNTQNPRAYLLTSLENVSNEIKEEGDELSQESIWKIKLAFVASVLAYESEHPPLTPMLTSSGTVQSYRRFEEEKNDIRVRKNSILLDRRQGQTLANVLGIVGIPLDLNEENGLSISMAPLGIATAREKEDLKRRRNAGNIKAESPIDMREIQARLDTNKRHE